MKRKQMMKLLVMAAFVLMGSVMYAQTVVTGKVVSATAGEGPIPGGLESPPSAL